jgi:chemotaxis protein CheC
MLLSEIHIDLIKELFNRGIGKSAAIIAEMLSSQIILSVPRLSIGSPFEIARELTPERVTGIKQSFSGIYKGEAMILYGHGSCLEVIGALLGYSTVPSDFGQLERETLSEFGNILISSCLYEFEQALDCKLATSAPVVISGQFPEDFISGPNGNEHEFMALSMDFSLSSKGSTGRLGLLLDPSDIVDMACKIDAYLERLMSG